MILTIALQIFATIILPIFALIGIGVAADRCFRLDLPTLSRLCFHLFLPGFLKMPILHAIWAALLLCLLHISLIPQLRQPLHYLGDGLIPVALLTLGVQLARSRLDQHLPSLLTVSIVRLAVSPLVAWGLTFLLGLTPPLSSIFVVAAGLPVAVNVYIIAAEYDLDRALASQAIFWTTLLSALTLSALLAFFSP